MRANLQLLTWANNRFSRSKKFRNRFLRTDRIPLLAHWFG